jgi:phosphate uptake regulator
MLMTFAAELRISRIMVGAELVLGARLIERPFERIAARAIRFAADAIQIENAWRATTGGVSLRPRVLIIGKPSMEASQSVYGV